MSSANLETPRQDKHVKHPSSADALSVLAALANQDRLTDCLAAARCLATARLVCRRLRDLVDGGVKSIQLSITHDKAETLAREQTLAALLRRWDRCQDLTVKLKGNWGDNAALFQTTPLWLFAGVSSNALSRIQAFRLSTCDLRRKKPDYIALVSALAARMSSLRRLDLYGCSHGWQHRDGIGAHLFTLFYTALAATCPQLETLVLPWGAYLPGVEALAGSLVRLRIGTGDDAKKSKWALSPAALQSISRLEHLRELVLEGLAFKDPGDPDLPSYDEDDDEDADEADADTEDEDGDEEEDSAEASPAGSKLLRLLDSLPPSVELLELAVLRFCMIPGWVLLRGIKFDFKHGWLQSVNVDGCTFGWSLRALTHALLRCRAMGAGAGGGVGPQQRPSLQIQGIGIGQSDEADAAYVAELGMLQNRVSFGALETIYFDSGWKYTDAAAQCAGCVVSLFGLPRKLWHFGLFSLRPLQLGGADATALTGAHAVIAAAAPAVAPAAAPVLEVAQGSTAAAAVTDAAAAAGAVVSAAAAEPSSCGGGSSHAGGSAAFLALETARVGDVLQAVAERLWADMDTSGAAGSSAVGAASTTTGGRELGRIVLLHRPRGEAAEWGQVEKAVNAAIERHGPWHLAGPQFALVVCYMRVNAEQLMAAASSPDGPYVREGIQATRLRAGAAKAAVQKVLVELWHGSATSGRMSPERRLERLVELIVKADRLLPPHE